MNLKAIHHVAIIVSDYHRAREFYVDKLGFEILRENYRSDKDDWKLDLKINDTTELEIFVKTNPPKRVTQPEAAGLRHLAFRVEDIDAAVEELTAKGIAVEPIRIDEFSGGKYTFFNDPDGLPIELHE